MPRKPVDDKARQAVRDKLAAKAKALADKARGEKISRGHTKTRAKKRVEARNNPATSTSSTPASAVTAPALAASVRATSAETAKEREYEIARLVTLSLPHAEIARRMTRKYGMPPSTTQAVIARCYAHWEKIAQNETGRDTKRAKMRETLGLLMDRALAIMDVKSAVVAADRIAKLDGLYAPEKIELGDGTVAQSEPDRVRERMRELIQKHGEKIGLRLPPALVPAVKTDEALAVVAVEPPKTATN